MNDGWIKSYRKTLDWEWFRDVNTAHFFQYCQLKANNKNGKWRGIEVKRGSFLSSLETMSVESGLSVQSVRTAKAKLESTGEITSISTNQYTIITICNYDIYQQNTKVVQQTEQQAEQHAEQQADQQAEQHATQQQTRREDVVEGKEEKKYSDDARVRVREGEFATPTGQATPQAGGQGDQSDTFHAEYRAELAGQTENAIRAQRVLKLSAEEVVKLLDEYHDKQKLNGSVYTSRRDYRQHFIMWAEKRVASKQQKEQAASNGIRLGCEEWIDENGRRTYGTGKFTVPNDAPPRPSVKHVWVNSDRQWTIL